MLDTWNSKYFNNFYTGTVNMATKNEEAEL